MKHLQKITINNTRRFGKDVEIDFGTGAHIILAPNGTGKTTVFEAIEFALTGSIQRLANRHLSLIRDKQDGMDVRLDFENNEYCEVNYRKGKEPILSGDHKLLYPKNDIAEVPFLLRLTHLLEQRGSNWFIQQEKPSEAGFLLDKLPLGKELNAIFKEKASILRSATDFQSRVNEKWEEAKRKLVEFEKKLNERKSATYDYVLRPLSEIVNEINTISQSIDNSVLKTEEKLDSLVAFLGQIESLLSYALENNSLLQIKLSKVENKIEAFEKNRNDLQKKEGVINVKNTTKEKIESDLKTIKDNITSVLDSINSSKEAQESLQELKRFFTRQQVELTNQLIVKNEIAEVSKLLPNTKEKLQQISHSLDTFKKLIAQHNVLRERERELRLKRAELSSLESVIVDWKKSQEIISNIEAVEIPKLTDSKNNSERSFNKLKSELEILEKQFEESRNKLTAHKNMADAIQSAVGMIAANIPENQSDCPVCGSTYEPIEFHNRINNALKEVNPLLTEEINRNKAIQEKVELTKNKVQKARINFIKIDEQLANEKEKIKIFQEIINEKYLPKFPDCKTPLESEVWINGEIGKLEDELLKVLNERKGLQKEPSGNEIDELTLKKAQEERKVESLEQNIQKLSLKLEAIKEELNKIEEKTKTIDIEKVNLNISQQEKTIEEFTRKLQKAQRKQETLEKQQGDTNKEILTERALITQLIGQQNEILSEWKEAKLDREPSLDTFNEMKKSILIREEELKGNKDKLNKIGGELARWKTAERFEKLNAEIKDICGELREDVYLDNLREHSKRFEDKYNLITERKSALNELLNKISSEVNNIHKQIVSINPQWVSLLKKVVINPKFVDTTLKSYPYHNQPHAEVEIPLHEGKVKVMDVASEAQATDLQLTLMLSMASNYQWTPWKALLLDDPTQHHDLVHAAGVFDLLRDYIVDQDFQIILGTHDSVQARFFQRKLQNDGVPVKLWSLIADSKGVKAELI